VEFSAAADELYGVLPAEFTATRKRLAGELPREQARRLTALRRPTVPAWAVNRLVRDGAVGPLLDLGERMRAAWSDGGDLAPLEGERASLVEELVRRARELADEAGRPLSDAFADEVEETLRAAIADPSAAEAVRAGRLDHPLRHAGFGPFGGAPAPARAAAPGRRKEKEKGTDKKAREERERKEREKEARAAERKADEAERSLAEWETALGEARQQLAAADEDLGHLRERLREAEARRADLNRRAEVAGREHDRAARAAKDARRRAGQLTRDRP
jgi:DNA repair exonuclease SbcCD ATPase subunit